MSYVCESILMPKVQKINLVSFISKLIKFYFQRRVSYDQGGGSRTQAHVSPLWSSPQAWHTFI